MNHDRISFCTTAMSRPKVLLRTYRSFAQNLRDIGLNQCTLHINIEPLPDEGARIATLDVARRFFGDVVCRMPVQPNFTTAVDWCWSSANTEFILHLEDDWALDEPVSVNTLLGFFDNSPKLIQVVMRAHIYKNKALYRDRVCLQPSVIRDSFYKAVGGKFDTSINPEVQLRKNEPSGDHLLDRLGISTDGCCMAYPDTVVVRDIGRPWIAQTKYRHPVNKADFTQWIENSQEEKP